MPCICSSFHVVLRSAVLAHACPVLQRSDLATVAEINTPRVSQERCLIVTKVQLSDRTENSNTDQLSSSWTDDGCPNQLTTLMIRDSILIKKERNSNSTSKNSAVEGRKEGSVRVYRMHFGGDESSPQRHLR